MRGVLLVEDDPDMQWRLARMLTVHGARVVGASSGEAEAYSSTTVNRLSGSATTSSRQKSEPPSTAFATRT